MDLDLELAAIAHGDADAYGRWLSHAERPLRESLRGFARQVDTEALLQEALLRVWQVAPQVKQDGRPNTLLRMAIRIARNLCINRIQRVTRREVEMPEYDYLQDRSAGPEEELVAASEREHVRRAVAALPAQHRTIIELCHFQECSYREIADILDVFSRVRSRHAQELEQYPPHVHVLPRHHNRETIASRHFLQRLVVHYDESIRALLKRTLCESSSSSDFGKQLSGSPTISLTFDYIRTSNIRTERVPSRGFEPLLIGLD